MAGRHVRFLTNYWFYWVGVERGTFLWFADVVRVFCDQGATWIYGFFGTLAVGGCGAVGW